MVALVLLAVLEIALSAGFILFILSGLVNEYILGGLMSAQLLVMSLIVVSCYRAFVTFREITEDREEPYLW
jgi:hypothetical protein